MFHSKLPWKNNKLSEAIEISGLGGRGHIGIQGVSDATKSVHTRHQSVDRHIEATSSMYKPHDTMLMRKRRVSLLNQPSTRDEDTRLGHTDSPNKGKNLQTSRHFYGKRATEAAITS
jgi:hypothetical protein